MVGAGHRVTVVNLERLLLTHIVGEGIVELLRRQRHGPVNIGGIAQDRRSDFERRKWKKEDAFDWGGCDGYTRGAEAAVEQDLRHQSAEGVSHNNRWTIQFLDDVLIVIDDFGDPQPRDLGRITA